MRLFFSLLGCFFATALSATPNSLIPITKDQLSTTHYPAPFVDVLRALHDGGFYDQQAADWEAVATGDCSTDEAWFHYYKTAHYSNRFGSGNYDLTAILAQAEKECDPEGFDLQYLYFAADQ
ncbi:MAG: hypothetical protein AAGF89_12420, partial [Bacteroidota bacterium]